MADFEQSETGNWNIAANWTENMIFKPFYEASQYLKIAFFGCLDIEEDFTFDEQTKIKSRIKGLKWAKYCIEQGIRNSKFAIRNSSDKDLIKKHLNDIVELNKYMPLIESEINDRDSKKIVINEEAFMLVYNVLMRIYTEVTEPMNRSDLIFFYKEQFDPSEFKNKIKERFAEGD